MPRVKVLKAVAHNIASTFTNSMSSKDDDYTLGHILRFARQTGSDTLTINLLTGKASPTAPTQSPISQLLNNIRHAKSLVIRKPRAQSVSLLSGTPDDDNGVYRE